MNSEMDTSGARFVPIADSTRDDDDANFRVSRIPSQLPTSAKVSSNSSALVMFSQGGSDPMQNVHSLQPIPSQTGVNLWQLQLPVT